jgi:hypothetical protein
LTTDATLSIHTTIWIMRAGWYGLGVRFRRWLDTAFSIIRFAANGVVSVQKATTTIRRLRLSQIRTNAGERRPPPTGKVCQLPGEAPGHGWSVACVALETQANCPPWTVEIAVAFADWHERH